MGNKAGTKRETREGDRGRRGEDGVQWEKPSIMVLALFHAGRVLGARTTLTGLWLAAETDLTSWATGRVAKEKATAPRVKPQYSRVGESKEAQAQAQTQAASAS
ncbi:predicted protein [Histoplasma capsulatum G186AR]|uniref:Uncharacterized protein n=1 Tax=Ajellomyces capsulatus (strain G186AR / H82 / ATCC MYA-2454 / RMSCC 2432) TaxID=447093 RepID=C0NBC0_AJECG|nr:uncharacterized protein HCBG_00416 [Histoplasma capsulatum G186AR]EEH10961.1 predicted protein [Histoplasma capsulatum G186AR]